MKKSAITVMIIFFTVLKSFSQNTYTFEKFNISFETTEELEFSIIGSENIGSFDNINVAVDIEAIPIEEESLEFVNDLKIGAMQIARDYGLSNIQDGGRLKKIDKGYYVVGSDVEGNSEYPVYVIAAIDNDTGLAYEISIDCYNLGEPESVKIIDSFHFVVN